SRGSPMVLRRKKVAVAEEFTGVATRRHQLRTASAKSGSVWFEGVGARAGSARNRPRNHTTPSMGTYMHNTVHIPTWFMVWGMTNQRQMPAPQLRAAVARISRRVFGISHRIKVS